MRDQDDRTTTSSPSPERAEAMKVADRRWQLVAAQPVATSRRYATTDPYDGVRTAEVPDADETEVAAVVAGAAAGATEWSRTDLRHRARCVRALAALAREHAAELAVLDALDVGNPVARTRGSLARAAEGMEYFADVGWALAGTALPPSAAASPHLYYTRREPYGVVARITAYNSPAFFAVLKTAPVLMAGNSLVLKAPDPAPLSTLRWAELAAEVLPPGTVSVVTGSGPVAGAALVAHEAVRRVSFIGSERTGRAIQRTAAEHGVKTVTLELGGKNPMVVFEDADAGAAADAAAGLFLAAAGQSCGSPSRVLVHASLHDRFVERLAQRAAEVRLGDPLQESTEMGPLVSSTHRDRVLGIVESSLAQGATLVTGGTAPTSGPLADGHFVTPTVLSDVAPGHPAFREEIFGPVVSVTRWHTEAEAVALANDSSLGLTASVFTGSVGTAHRTVAALEAGYVWVNEAGPHQWGLPFGGVKASGIGREEAAEELVSFTQVKGVSVAL